jgi:hypothetical protein
LVNVITLRLASKKSALSVVEAEAGAIGGVSAARAGCAARANCRWSHERRAAVDTERSHPSRWICLIHR